VEALTVILRHGDHKQLPFLPALASFRKSISGVPREPKLLENLGLYIESKIPAKYIDFKVGIVATIIELADYDCLAGEEADWLMHLNRWLAMTGGNEESWKAAKRLGKTEDFTQYANIRAFALGTSLPLELERKGPGRFGLVSALVQVHGKKMDELMDMGFFQAEIEEAGAKNGLFSRIKRLFGR
jgi:hypothetical protein